MLELALTAKEFDWPVIAPVLTLMIFEVSALVMTTVPLQTPFVKALEDVGVMVAVSSVMLTVLLKLVSGSLEASSARIVIMNGCPAT